MVSLGTRYGVLLTTNRHSLFLSLSLSFTPSLVYLANQTGEYKDAQEKVSHLKGNLKDRVGLTKTPDVDETADCVVVRTEIPVERVGVRGGEGR